MKIPIGIIAVLLGSSLWALAQQTTTKEPALPPLPPGLPADSAKAVPTKQLTDQEKAAAKEANEAAKAERLRRIEQAEKFLQTPLRSADGKPATLEKLEKEKTARVLALGEEFKRRHAENQRELEEWMQKNAHRLPRMFEGQRPVGIENGYPQFPVTFNQRAAGVIQAATNWPGGAAGLSLTGAGIQVGLWDVGLPLTNHTEFTTNRVLRLETATNVGIRSHPTEMAGTIAASGQYAASRGIAYEAKVLAFDANLDIDQMLGMSGTNGLRISNHSYGRGTHGWILDGNEAAWFGDFYFSTNSANPFEDHKFGTYGFYAYQQDALVYGQQTYLPIRAVGNDRDDIIPNSSITFYVRSNNVDFVVMNGLAASYVSDGDEGGYDTIVNDATGKNVLSVGGVYAGSYGTPKLFSGYGPTDDGRIKPDIMGVGEYLATTADDNGYTANEGTSGATASVSGVLAQILQHYRTLYGTNREPLASTLKGLLLHTATDIVAQGPDYQSGWGLVNASDAASLLTANTNFGSHPHLKEVWLDNGGSIEFPITVSNVTALKLTACWTDPVGNYFSGLDKTNLALVNDLDLRVYSPDGTTNFPWILNPDLAGQTSAARSQAAGKGDNFRDNVEQVSLTSPTNGTYLVRLTHKGTLQQPGSSPPQQAVTLFLTGNQPEAAPELRLQTLMATNGNVLVNWPSVVGQRYRMEYKDDLNVTNWTAYGDVVAGRTNVTISVSPTNDARFFQLKTVD